MEFLPETLQYITATSLGYRKRLGQFFTPKSLREELLSKLPRLKKPKVLDPGCGTGEFLLSAREYFRKPQLYGWEIDETLGKIAQRIVPEANIELTDALRKDWKEEFDVVIGNPPYFEFKPDPEIRAKFAEVCRGRINIYALFIYLGLKVLRSGGYLAYVVSSSMNNGAYFSRLRQFIVKEANIEYMHVLDGDFFEDALQSVMIFVLKKGSNKGNYLFSKNGILIFSEQAEHLKNIFKGKTTLGELGYNVQTGRVVWNQNKHLLSFKDGVPLIWSHNITRQGLKLNNNPGKPQYINIPDPDIGPAIVVNRIVGRPNNGSLKAALIPPGFKFVGENHVNVIYPSKEATMLEMEHIVAELNSIDNQQVLRAITGNTQISKNELEKLFPINLKRN